MPDPRLDEAYDYSVLGQNLEALREFGPLIDFLRKLVQGYSWTPKDESQDQAIRAIQAVVDRLQAVVDRLNRPITYSVLGPNWEAVEKQGTLLDYLEDLASGWSWTRKDESQDQAIRSLAESQGSSPGGSC